MAHINWYPIITASDLENLATPTIEAAVNTDEYGLLEFRICYGILLGVVYKNIYLPIGLNGQNPFKRGDYCVYKDDNNLWFGIMEQ